MLRGVRWAMAVALTTTAVVVTTVELSRGEPALSADALLRFERESLRPVRDVGLLIDIGVPGARSMKHAIMDIENGELTGDELAEESAAWVRSIEQAEDALEAVDTPSQVSRAKTLMLSSFKTYRSLAQVLGTAADTRDAEGIDSVLDRAVRLGARGDALFDEASAVIQRARHELGFPPSSDLPDPGDAPLPSAEVIE